MRKLLLLSGTFLFTTSFFAQNPVEIFTKQRDSLPQENIYVQLDKAAYIAGDTIWFKSYLFSDYNSSTLSTNFFISLLDKDSKIIITNKFPVFSGTVRGNIFLPDTLAQGAYLLVAYTTWTLNLGSSYVFKQAVPVFNPSKKSSVNSILNHQNNCNFYPENGSLINDLLNTVAFKAINEFQQPLLIQGSVSDSKGEEITSFSSNNNGLGTFSFMPEAGKKYIAKIQFPDNTSKQYDLPVAMNNGVLLSVADNNIGKVFSVSASPGSGDEFDSLLLLAVMQNNVVVEKNIILVDHSAEGVVNTADLPSGLMQFLLFNQNNKLIAARNSFANYHDFLINAELHTDILDFSSKAKNAFSLMLPDSLQGNFSLSITDADREMINRRNENILNGLLLQPGSKQWISTIDNNATKNDLDLIVLTNQWPIDPVAPQVKYRDQSYIDIEGKAFYETEKRPLQNEEVDLLLVTKDSSQKTLTVPITANGTFDVSNLIYEDTAEFFFPSHTQKNPDKSLIIEPVTTFDYSFFLKNINRSSFINAVNYFFVDTTKSEIVKNLYQAHLNIMDNEKILPGVVLKSKKVSQVMETNNRYTKGLFSNATLAKTYDFIHDPPVADGQNIFEYLRGRVPGLLISREGGKYIIQSPRSVSFYEMLAKPQYDQKNTNLIRSLSLAGFESSGNGLVRGKVFVDEIELETTDVELIPISNIALVKFFPPGSVQLPGVGISCVLAIYTKKVEDLKSQPLDYMKSFLYPGYSKTLSFSLPDYSINEKNVSDSRVTLYWNPDIILNGESKEVKIKFYNSDLAKRFHIVFEGITSDGRLVHFDKIAE